MGRTLGVGVVLAALLVGSGTAAQDVPPKGEIVVPDPSRCEIEPRPVADLARYVGTPAARETSSPTVANDEVALPKGEPADPEAAAAVVATIEELYACYNANDYPRVFALFTDDGLRRVLPDFGLTEKDLAFIAETPVPAPKEAWRAVAVQQVVGLPDGRVGALIEGRAPGEGFAAVAILVAEDGRYLVDELTTISVSVNKAATPAA